MRRLFLTVLFLFIAAAAVADTFNPNPITYRMNTLMVLDGSGGVPPTNGNVNVNQPSNGADAIDVYRFTDSSPTGNYFSCINHANNSRPCLIDALGDGNFVGNLVGNGQVAAGTAFASGAVAGDITSSESTTVGKIFFGSNGTHFLGFDGTNYNLPVSNTNVFSLNVNSSSALINSSGSGQFHDIAVPVAGTAFTVNNTGDIAGHSLNINSSSATITSAGAIAGLSLNINSSAATITSGGALTAASGDFAGASSVNGSILEAEQTANGLDSIISQRFTDSGPTGFFFRGVNHAANTAIMQIDVNGNITGNSLNVNGSSSPGNNTVETAALTVDTSVSKDAGGIKHLRVGTGTIAAATTNTTAGLGMLCATFNWTTAFADNNYTVSCDVNQNDGFSQNIFFFQTSAKTNAGFSACVANRDTTATHSGVINCIAMHD